jgi:hypothetical protein
MAVTQSDGGRIPPAIRHVLQLIEEVCLRVKNGCSWISIEGIILFGAPESHAASIGKKRPAIAEDIPLGIIVIDGACRFHRAQLKFPRRVRSGCSPTRQR